MGWFGKSGDDAARHYWYELTAMKNGWECCDQEWGREVGRYYVVDQGRQEFPPTLRAFKRLSEQEIYIRELSCDGISVIAKGVASGVFGERKLILEAFASYKSRENH